MTEIDAAERRERFARDGYCVLPDVFDASTLAMLREESRLAVEWQEDALRRGAADVETLNRLGERYFVPRRSVERPALRELLLSERTFRSLGDLLGPDAYLFIDVFIHKVAERDNAFEWHQDHGYVSHYGFGHFPPNVTVWTPLDDVDDENGALHVLPFSRGAAREAVPHRIDEATGDVVVDVDERDGECVPMRAGSVLVLAGLLPHRSGPNRSGRPRRAYQWQYSSVPVLDGGRPISLALPFVRGGEYVGDTASSAG